MEDYKRSVTTGGESEYKSNPADFMKLLEGETAPRGQQHASKNRTVHNDDNLAMRQILEKFHSVSEQSVSLLERSEIKQLASKKTSTDREWKVILSEGEGGYINEKDMYYDIVNTKTNKSYFYKIKTLEAADLIIDHLERKEPINSTKIFKVLDLDETFRRNRIDAIQFKNKWKKLVEKKRYANADIYEARYQKSKQLAIEAKRELKKM